MLAEDLHKLTENRRLRNFGAYMEGLENDLSNCAREGHSKRRVNLPGNVCPNMVKDALEQNGFKVFKSLEDIFVVSW